MDEAELKQALSQRLPADERRADTISPSVIAYMLTQRRRRRVVFVLSAVGIACLTGLALTAGFALASTVLPPIDRGGAAVALMWLPFAVVIILTLAAAALALIGLARRIAGP